MPRYTDEQARRMNEIISGALKNAKVARRHPAEVTAGRLGDAVQRWHDQFETGELDMVGVIINRLNLIAESDGKATW